MAVRFGWLFVGLLAGAVLMLCILAQEARAQEEGAGYWAYHESGPVQGWTWHESPQWTYHPWGYWHLCGPAYGTNGETGQEGWVYGVCDPATITY